MSQKTDTEEKKNIPGYLNAPIGQYPYQSKSIIPRNEYQSAYLYFPNF